MNLFIYLEEQHRAHTHTFLPLTVSLTASPGQQVRVHVAEHGDIADKLSFMSR